MPFLEADQGGGWGRIKVEGGGGSRWRVGEGPGGGWRCGPEQLATTVPLLVFTVDVSQ